MTLEQHQVVRRDLIRRAVALRARYRRVAIRGAARALRNFVEFACRAVWRAAVGLALALVRSWRIYVANRQHMRDVAVLHALSDRDLQDIGVPRSGIDWATRHGRDDSYTRLGRTVRAHKMSDLARPGPHEPPAPANADAVRERAA